jgi:hypothetical protein
MGGSKEFQEPARRLVTGVGDDRRHDDRCCDGGRNLRRLGGWDDSQLAGSLPRSRFAIMIAL